MKISQLLNIMDETGLSAEKIAACLHVSNMTYRRWRKRSPEEEIPKEYARNIAGGIYQLVAEDKLHPDSREVGSFLKSHLPEFFQAAIGRFKVSEALFDAHSPQQENITSLLSHIGNNANVREQVDAAALDMQRFARLGADWKQRITLLSKAIRSRKITAIDKLAAYGSLFYLIIPFDLIPDSIPVFGMVDDFGILGFACAFYCQRFPALFVHKEMV